MPKPSEDENIEEMLEYLRYSEMDAKTLDELLSVPETREALKPALKSGKLVPEVSKLITCLFKQLVSDPDSNVAKAIAQLNK